MRSLAVCSALVVALSLTSDALAHENEPRHRVIVTVRPELATPGKPPETSALTMEALILMELPASRRATRLIGLYDLDRSGDLNAFEARLVAGALGQEAVGGLLLSLDGQVLKPTHVDATATLNRGRDGLVVALMLSFKVASRLEDSSTLSLFVVDTREGTPMRQAAMVVEVQVPAPLSLIQSSARRAEDVPVVGPVAVLPGGTPLEVEFVLGPQRRKR